MALVRNPGITFESSDGSGVYSFYVSDHGRKPIQISYNRIEKSVRTADGTLRKQVIATKKSYEISWDNLPSLTSKTVDGFAGAAFIQDWYDSNTGPFNVKFTFDDGTGVNNTSEIARVVISDFSYEIAIRSTRGFDMVNVSIKFEEV